MATLFPSVVPHDRQEVKLFFPSLPPGYYFFLVEPGRLLFLLSCESLLPFSELFSVEEDVDYLIKIQL